MLYSPRRNYMSSVLNYLLNISPSNVIHLLVILAAALILNHLLRLVTKLIVKPASTQTRAAQAREQQTRTLAGVINSAGSKVVWAVALLTAAQEFGINITPVAALAGLASLAVGFGAQNLVRDIISGFYIILEDQYVVGDTIQVGDTIGRVEHLTLRRTVVRDPRVKRRHSNRGEFKPRLVAGIRRRERVAANCAGESAAGVGSGNCGVSRRSRVVAGACGRSADSGTAILRSNCIDNSLAGAHGSIAAGRCGERTEAAHPIRVPAARHPPVECATAGAGKSCGLTGIRAAGPARVKDEENKRCHRSPTKK
jgi:Mechanosensitive ion channel